MRRRSNVIAGVAVLLLAGQVQAGTVYDAVSGFSRVKNTKKSTWSYRYNTTGVRDGKYTLLSTVNPSDTEWSRTTKKGTKFVKTYIWSSPSYPYISDNAKPYALTTNYCCGVVTWPADTMFMDVGSAGDSVLSFLAPKAGAVSIAYSFTDIDPYGGDGIRWYVDLNNAKHGDLASGALDSTDPNNLATTGPQELDITVKAGDHIDFIIDNNADFRFDSTALTATVTYAN